MVELPDNLGDYLAGLNRCGFCGRLVYGEICRDETDEPCDKEMDYWYQEQWNQEVYEQEMRELELQERYEQLAREWREKGWM